MLDLPEDLTACLADKPEAALIHVDFLGGLQPERLQKKLDSGKWSHAVGFRPTGQPLSHLTFTGCQVSRSSLKALLSDEYRRDLMFFEYVAEIASKNIHRASS